MAATPQPTRTRRWVRRAVITAIVVAALAGVALLCMTVEPFRATYWRTAGQDCGQVTTFGQQVERGGHQVAAQAEACFMHAQTACRAATLTMQTYNLDVTSSDTFVVEPSFGALRACGLADAWSRNGHLQTIGVTTCAHVVQAPDGLHFQGCGDFGTIAVPV